MLSSAHDMRREFRVISAVHGTGVPVPVAIDVVDDTDARQVTGTTFLLMERAPGLALSTVGRTPRSPPRDCGALSVELVQHLADLHAIDPTAVGLADFGRPDGYLDRQLVDLAPPARRISISPAARAGGPGGACRAPSAAGRTGIVHGDYRLTTSWSRRPAIAATSRRSWTGRWRPSAIR